MSDEAIRIASEALHAAWKEKRLATLRAQPDGGEWEPDWSQAPTTPEPGAQWYSVDANGAARWWKRKPRIITDGWMAQNMDGHGGSWRAGTAHLPIGTDWRTTLRQRPEEGESDGRQQDDGGRAVPGGLDGQRQQRPMGLSAADADSDGDEPALDDRELPADIVAPDLTPTEDADQPAAPAPLTEERVRPTWQELRGRIMDCADKGVGKDYEHRSALAEGLANWIEQQYASTEEGR